MIDVPVKSATVKNLPKRALVSSGIELPLGDAGQRDVPYELYINTFHYHNINVKSLYFKVPISSSNTTLLGVRVWILGEVPHRLHHTKNNVLVLI